MSWLFSSEIDDAIEKATSELLPSNQEDLEMNLEICDKIRSRQVNAKDAMRALKKRLSHKNANVQLLTLKLLDVCVKNGGLHFLVELASREFMDAYVQVLNAPTTFDQVRQEMLRLLQQWSIAFQSKSELSYVVDTVESLKSQGFRFPAIEKSQASSAMIDTNAPPDWTDSDVCERCRTLFTLTNRKHHCRNCGKTFCQQCSSKNLPLPHIGLNQPVRVCDGCFGKYSSRSGSNADLLPPRSFATTDLTGSGSREDEARRKEEEELQRAIALSMLENQKNGGNGGNRKQKEKMESEEDDPELRAAILASLKESEKSRDRSISPGRKEKSYYPEAGAFDRAQTYSRPSPSASPAPSNSSAGPVPSVPSGKELSKAEQQNIQMFFTLMEKMDSDPNNPQALSIEKDQDMRALYDFMTRAHPRVVSVIEDCVEKHKMYMDIHDKLTNAVRTYDRLIDQSRQRAQAAAYQQPPVPAYASVPAAQQPSFYNGYAPAPSAGNTATYPPPGAQYQPTGQYAPPPQSYPAVNVAQPAPYAYYGSAVPVPSSGGYTQSHNTPYATYPQSPPQPQQQQPPAQEKPLIDF